VEASNTFWSRDQAAALGELLLGHTQQIGVIYYDDALRITAWNEGAHFMTGWTADDVLGQPTAIMFVPEDRSNRLDVHEANTARVVGVAEDERWHLRKDGSRFWSSGVSLPLRSVAGKPAGFVKIFRDLTHIRTRLKHLENLVQEFEVHRRDKNVFIGTIAHEMRNPLSPLKTAVELLKRSPDSHPHHLQTIRIVDRQIGFLDRLIEDLVDLTRVQTGKLNVVYEVAVLQEVLYEAIHGCEDVAKAKGITIHEVMPPVPIQVEVDPRRLQQVMLNLFNNAIKYTHAGGNIWLTATVDQTHFLCYVKDDGQGIGPELLPQIFDMFTQADSCHGGRGDGLGIGLAIVHEIVALHQGNVEVRSEGDGRGSEFTVRIPRRRPNGPQAEPLS
jgi:PAS domain S-box-containing protein